MGSIPYHSILLNANVAKANQARSLLLRLRRILTGQSVPVALVPEFAAHAHFTFDTP